MPALGELIGAIHLLPAREVSALETCVLSIGAVETPGSVWNVLAEKACLHGGIRAFNPAVRELLNRRVKELAEDIALANRCTATVERSVGYAPCINGEKMTAAVVESLRETLGADKVNFTDEPAMTSEDCGEYMERVPGTFFWLGVASSPNAAPLHSPYFCLNTEALVTGVAVAVVGAISGFTCGPSNPFTVAVAQAIAGLDLYFGISLRVVMFAIIPLLCLLYILRYAAKVRKDPSASLVVDVEVADLKFNADEFESQPFTVRHALILATLVVGIGFYVYGSINWRWGFPHLGAIFVLLAIVSGALSGQGVNEIADTFLKGAADMVGGCFIMGVAYGISWILSNAKVLDTIVYYLLKPLAGLSPVVCSVGILIVIAIINLFIPSGSGKALIVMPIVLPIAQIVGIESQTAILAYQFGDGITNLCTSLLGVLLLALGIGRAPFSKWERFIIPLTVIFFLVAAVFMVIAIKIGYR